jgi:DNA-binding HxlR family transcriptional regulator
VRSYNQFCPAARALDVVGDRWTLLIVRELLVGPKRYSELQEGLPGINPTLLSERLRSLEAAGVVRRGDAYELTELGAELRGVLGELFRWGMRTLSAPGAKEAIRASWLLAALEATARPGGGEVEEDYEFRVGDEVLTVHAGTRVEARHGAAEDPALVLTTDPETLAALGMRRLTPEAAVGAGRLTVEGDPAAARRCSELFELLQEVPA